MQIWLLCSCLGLGLGCILLAVRLLHFLWCYTTEAESVSSMLWHTVLELGIPVDFLTYWHYILGVPELDQPL